MATNSTKKTRANDIDELQKVVDGYTKYEPTAPTVMSAGVTLKPSDVIARFGARIAQAKSVDAGCAWDEGHAAEGGHHHAGDGGAGGGHRGAGGRSRGEPGRGDRGARGSAGGGGECGGERGSGSGGGAGDRSAPGSAGVEVQ